MKLSRAFLTVVAMLAASGASAEWIALGATDEGRHFINTTEVVRSGSLVRFWIRVNNLTATRDPETGRTVGSTEENHVVNCAERTHSILSIINFPGPNGIGAEMTRADRTLAEAPLTPIRPGSVAAIYAKAICP